MRKLFLLEDDLSLISGLTFAFKKQGFALDTARTLAEAEVLWSDRKYDLLVLDVSLPDGSGFDFCQKVRRTSNVPILFLTASDEEMNIIMGLDMGGDDYLTKPFKLGVLLSRVNALLRRANASSAGEPVLESGSITVRLLQGQAYKNGILLELTGAEYKLLCFFMQHPNAVLSKEQILDALWDCDGDYIDSSALTVYIRRLRLEMETYTEIRTQIGMIEINFCINGRFETSFSMRDSVLLKPGDMAVSCYDGRHGTRSESRFPLGCYEGLCLEVDPAAAQNWLEKNAPGFSVDFAVLKQNLLGNRWFMFGTAGPRCEHVFRELYENAPYMDLRFLRLKVVELLMLLSRIPQEEGTDLYCSTEQTELAHHLRDHLLTNREGYVSLAQLAEEHGISVSHLQKMFKQVYGVPVYHYIKEYRLEQAAVELVRSAKPITQIAQNAGYDNASKFSEAFRKRYGTTPSQYRTHANGLAKRSREIRME